MKKQKKRMIRRFYITSLLYFIIFSGASAQQTDSLREKITGIIALKHARVGVAIAGKNGKDTLSINGEGHFPLQSVFKFHIALAVLSQIDQGKFSVDQQIKIEKKDLLPNLYSPIRDEHPRGASLSVSTILAYTVSKSDNVGCDALLRLIGGPATVEEYLAKNNFKNVSIKTNEEQQQNNWDLQFQNWTTPKAANEILMSYYYNRNQRLSKKTYELLWKLMKETQTGEHRLRGGLPKETVVAHKTGSSGTNKQGLTAAVNDIGIVFLPNGHPFFISVFVTASTEDAATNEKIIADIAKVTWDYFRKKTP